MEVQLRRKLRKNKMERNYLERLAAMKTPILAGGFNIAENHQVYHDYCELRNLAKDLLIDTRDKEAIIKLSELIKKLGLVEANLLN